MRSWSGAFAAVVLVALGAAGCGKTDAGGGAGSETHWLLECRSDSDCGIGSCLCGVCTLACNSLRDCPEPLDVCSTETAMGVCEQRVCGSSLPAESQQGLVSASPRAVERRTGCDNGRKTEVTFVDVSFRATGPDFPTSPVSTLIAESPQGFLLFGDSQSFYRIDGAGSLIRTLQPPQSALGPVIYEDAIPLEDGSLLLSGNIDHQAWVGKVDAAWHVVWEHMLDMSVVQPTAIVATADGGAVVAGQQGTVSEGLAPFVDSLTWVRISPTGEELWRHQEAMHEPTVPVKLVILGGENIQIAFAGADGIHLLSCDLEGNYDLAPLVRPGGQLAAKRLLRLPNGQTGLAYLGGFLLVDQTAQVVWDHRTDAQVGDAAYDPTRQQIFLVGGSSQENPGGAWVERLSPTGESNWSFSRAQWPAAPRGVDWNQYAYFLDQVAVDGAGHVAARSPTGSTGLDIMWLDDGPCDTESVP